MRGRFGLAHRPEGGSPNRLDEWAGISCPAGANILEGSDALEPSKIYPSNTSECMSSMILGDMEATFLNSIRNTSPIKLPILLIDILYKNVLGGCFISNTIFLVHPQNEEQDGIISEWITSVISFLIKFKDEIAAIKSSDKINPEKSDALFEELKERSSQLITNDDIKLMLRPLSYEVKAISIDQYNVLTRNQNYGMPLPPKKACLPLCQEI